MNPLDARRRLLGRNVYKKTVEGNPAIAQGSLARRNPGITMQGWTEQAQYDGNQLLPLPVGKVIESESGKNTLTVTENGVNLNITEPTTSAYTNDIYIFGNSQYNIEAGYEDASVYIPQGLYTLLNDTITNLEVFLSVWRNGVKIDLILSFATRPANFTIMDGDKIRLGIRPRGTLEINNMMLMVIKQTLPSTTPFEPYTGGAPSPSPDYPQPITSAGKYNEGTGKYQYQVKLTGANLFDGSQFGQNGKVIHIDATSGNRDITGIDYKPNTAYTISIEGYEIVTPNGNWTANFTVYYTDGTLDQRYTQWLVENPLVTNKNKTIRRIVLGNPWGVGETITGIMVNEGSTALPYEPYRLPQTVTLTSDRPLTKWDKLEKRNGQWGWVYKSAEIVLDGSEAVNAGIILSEGVKTNRVYWYVDVKPNSSGYCDKLKEVYPGNISGIRTVDEPCFNISNGAMLQVRIPVEFSSDTDSLKEWLSENNLTFLCETAEETFVPLSSSEQEQMNELYTFRPTTVLSNDCECKMTLMYKTKKSLEVTT